MKDEDEDKDRDKEKDQDQDKDKSKRSQDPTVQELRETAEAIEKLAGNPEAFNEAHDAFVATDSARFEAALSKVGIAHLAVTPGSPYPL